MRVVEERRRGGGPGEAESRRRAGREEARALVSRRKASRLGLRPESARPEAMRRVRTRRRQDRGRQPRSPFTFPHPSRGSRARSPARLTSIPTRPWPTSERPSACCTSRSGTSSPSSSRRVRSTAASCMTVRLAVHVWLDWWHWPGWTLLRRVWCRGLVWSRWAGR